MKKQSEAQPLQRTWLLLRGLTRGQGHWGEVPKKLQEHFPRDRVLLLDLPGNGEKFQESSPWTLRGYVDFLRRQMQEQNVVGELRILAVSLGGMVALEWMKLYPNEIKKAFLINTSLRGSGAFHERLRPQNYAQLLKVLSLKNVQEREKLILAMTSRNLQAQEKHLENFTNFSKKYPVNLSNFFRQLTAAAQARLEDKAPGDIILFISSHDNFINSKCSYTMARKWGIKAHTHPWAGHDLSLDDPDWLIQHLD